MLIWAKESQFMEVVAYIIILSILAFGICIILIGNRNKNGLLLTLFLYIFILIFGIGDFLHIESLKLFSAIILGLSFFLIPVYIEFINKVNEGEIVTSKGFTNKYNLDYSNEIPDYIYEEILENHGELDPLNTNSCFRDKSIFDGIFANEPPFSVTYDSVITCPIDELKFYLIERNLTYKYRKSRKHSDIGPNFYTLNDFICIIESDISRDIPDFITQDRIPFVDSMKYCLEFFDNKYINFNFDRNFSNSYIIKSSNSKKVKDYFSLKIRNAFSNNKIKDVTMKSVNNRLLVRFPHRISLDDYRAVFCVGCAFFKKEIDMFNTNNMDKVLKSDNYDEEGSILDYFRDSNGDISIPPMLGGFIIFIMSLVVIALIGKYL